AKLGPVTLAQPFVDHRGPAHLVRTYGADLRCIADSAQTVAAVAAAAGDRPVDVFLKIDVGLHRCGVDPNGDAALAVARSIANNSRLRFAGLFSHAGHAYGAGNPDGVRKVATE
ncbi:alanine racemase, partial [Mycobacterium tuberculosis]|nr:alanine racemase [Mycobacterium tuberculosis]